MTATTKYHGLTQSNAKQLIRMNTLLTKLTGTALASVAAFLLVLNSAQAQFWNNKQPELLPEEEAFALLVEEVDGELHVNWSIADGYYMYRDKFRVETQQPGVQIGEFRIPDGTIEDDPEFGEVEVYFYNAALTAPVSAADGKAELLIHGQGCNKPVGVCYPPMQRVVTVDISAAGPAPLATTTTGGTPEAAGNSAQKSFFGFVLTAFGAGLLLSFTPCVLPMIPILAGVIAGQQNPTRAQSGWLAICYVAGTVVTYIIAGWVAGATGAQLQAYFQNPWVIGSICALLVLLAGSLFGWFQIAIPSSWQTRINNAQVNSRSASISSFGLGLLSALVVGACVSPILILALGAAITQGDPLLGASIMGAMAVGMGMLLILFGFGAGWILPKAGAWMQQVQVIFGLMVLGVAIYLIDTLGMFPSLYLWAALLLFSGLYLWALVDDAPGTMLVSGLRTVSAGLLLWGAMSVVGGSLGGTDILRPLSQLGAGVTASQAGATERSPLPFTTVTTLREAKSLLEQAQRDGRPALVDFYADWCLDCKRMHRTTFKQQSVASALSGWSLIEIDVTKTNDDSQEVKRFFDVFGPPATLFIGADGNEVQELRQYGYLNEQDFLTLVQRTGQAPLQALNE